MGNCIDEFHIVDSYWHSSKRIYSGMQDYTSMHLRIYYHIWLTRTNPSINLFTWLMLLVFIGTSRFSYTGLLYKLEKYGVRE